MSGAEDTVHRDGLSGDEPGGAGGRGDRKTHDQGDRRAFNTFAIPPVWCCCAHHTGDEQQINANRRYLQRHEKSPRGQTTLPRVTTTSCASLSR